MSDILEKLSETLQARRNASPEASYTASLLTAGLPRLQEKLEEDLGELIEAAENLQADADSQAKREALIHEAADLWFHSMALLVSQGVRPTLVLEELERRFGTSGHEEKRSRPAGR